MAVANRIRNTNIRPMGTSTPRMRMFSGTLNSRGLRSLNRSTTIASALNTKLHTTPKAYASPSTYMLPRLATIVISCRPTIR